jgi:hypothetical protein
MQRILKSLCCGLLMCTGVLAQGTSQIPSLTAARASNTACSTTTNTNFRRILTLTRQNDIGLYAADLDTYT